MTDPRIRYDILANAQGEEDVARLAAELEKLDDAIDPQAAAKAKALAEELRALAEKRAGIEAFLRSLTEANAAAAALENAQQAADKLGRQLEAVERPTRAQSGQMEKLRDAVDRAQRALTEKTAALNTARVGVERLGIGTTELGAKQQALTTALAGTKAQASQLAAAYQATATSAAASAAAQVRAQGQAKAALEDLNSTYRRLQSVAALAIGGGVFTGLIRDVATTADAYKNLEARIKLVTGEGAAFQSAFQGVEEIAKRTSSSLESTGTLFARVAEAGRNIGIGQQQSLELTETITKAVALSGSSAQAADAAVTQLIQGLQSGVLRGQEFNSVNEQSTRVIQALADGLGVTRGELRKMAEEGRLTTEVVLPALASQSRQLQKEFETLPPTIGRAIQSLSNSWTLYIGEVDKAGGASEQAATLIKALADNLETLASVLFSVGKAAAAYKALQLAQTFLGISTAAKAATAEVVALTAAQNGATAAATSAAAATSRYATILAGLRAFTVVGILANAKEIGTAIGEGVAKLAGYGRTLELNESLLRAEAEATQRNAAEKAELAAITQRLSDKQLGLAGQSKALVVEFDELRKKGESVGDSLAKISKDFKLGDQKGISDAVIALDALRQTAKITADQLRDTLGNALKGINLGDFEEKAKKAFGAGADGVRRLKSAIDAVTDESLRRAGSSVQELRVGFSESFRSAFSDVTALDRGLKSLGANGEATGRLLSGALDKALTAASTEKAVQAVIDRMQELAKQGRLSGDALEEGLERARKKLDELKPGVNSLNEALRVFGLKTKTEMDKVADTFRQAYDTIRNDATVSFEQKQTAFKAYADAAIAANGGIATSELKLKAEAVQLRVELDETGKTVVRSMAESEQAIERAASRFPSIGTGARRAADDVKTLSLSFGQLGAAADAAGAKARKAVQDSELPSLGSARPGAIDIRDPNYLDSRNARVDRDLPKIDSFGARIRDTPSGGITRTGTGQVPYPAGEAPGDFVFVPFPANYGNGIGEWRRTPEAQARLDAQMRGIGANDPGGYNGSAGYSPFGSAYRPGGALYAPPAPAPAPMPTSVPERTVTVQLQLAGGSYPLTGSEEVVDDLLRQLERSRLSTGG